MLDAAKKLIAIGTFCIGTNQIDLDYARQKGIPVFNAPFSNTRSVAELVLAELIFLMRGIPEKNAAAHRGQWIKSADNAYEIRGKKLGIVGFGHIGSQLGILAEALGMRVYYHDIENKLPLGNARAVDSLDELLEKVDALSLHVPATPQTRNMIGKEQIARMKPGSYLLNAARGDVVDIEALTAALESGHIAGAAIDVFPVEPASNEQEFISPLRRFDVFPVEPASNEQEFISPLRRFDQVILTPHIGGSTQEAQVNIADEVSNKLIKYSNNGTTSSAPGPAPHHAHPPEHSGHDGTDQPCLFRTRHECGGHVPANPGRYRLRHYGRGQPHGQRRCPESRPASHRRHRARAGTALIPNPVDRPAVATQALPGRFLSRATKAVAGHESAVVG